MQKIKMLKKTEKTVQKAEQSQIHKILKKYTQ